MISALGRCGTLFLVVGGCVEKEPTGKVTTTTTTTTTVCCDTTTTTSTTSTTTTPYTPGPVRYARDVRPILTALCNDCHHPGSAGDFDFTDPFDPVTGLVGRANSWAPNGSDETLLVDPGNPDNSFLLVKITDEALDPHIDGNPMPYLLPTYTPAERDALAQWITDGAQNDAFFRAEVAPLFGTEVTLRSTSGRCTWCHYPGSPTGMSVIDVFDPDEGMVGRTSLFGGLIVDPGNPEDSVLLQKIDGVGPGDPMPLHHRRVTPTEIATIREWIVLGALDD